MSRYISTKEVTKNEYIIQIEQTTCSKQTVYKIQMLNGVQWFCLFFFFFNSFIDSGLLWEPDMNELSLTELQITTTFLLYCYTNWPKIYKEICFYLKSCCYEVMIHKLLFVIFYE